MKHLFKALERHEPQVMAIVNVTDDSFFEGSRTPSGDAIEERVAQALEDGATIFDVGGASSRSGAEMVDAEEEWQRVRRGVEAVRRLSSDVPVSVDTCRAEVARRAIEKFGELIINDISAGEADARMIDVVARAGVPYVAMHMRGEPLSMQRLTDYPKGVVAEVRDYFVERLATLRERGVERVIIDPGFGFAKNVEQNYELLAGLSEICDLGVPVLAGLSRKSMIYRTLGIMPAEALNGTTALNWEALRQGATILRVHDVKEAVEVVQLFEKLPNKGNKKACQQ